MRLAPSRLTHVGPIATRMRAEDQRECRALGLSPKEALRQGMRASLYCLTVIEDDSDVTAMFGLTAVSLLGGVARPWLLGTDRLFDHGRDLLLIGRQVLGSWGRQFPHMENIVSAENVKAIRLLMRWGAEIGSDVETYRGLAFVPFTIQAQRAPS